MNETPLTRTEQIPEIITDILRRRGLDEAAIQAFIFPDYDDHLHDPFLLLGMEAAVARIGLAAKNNQKVAIYGDYDIDGITASAVMLEMMNHLGIRAESYIPDRFEEGYGINQAALASLKRRGFDLVISVDCGITSVDEAIWARDNGLDLIITDHHAVPEVIPEAIAVINPKRLNDPYPFKDLAGVGVAFKLAQALQLWYSKPEVGKEKWLLDLVALGTVCDVVPLVGENRVLVFYGLKVLRQTRRVGLRALVAVSRVSIAELNSYHLGFVLGPRMNAAGRLEHAARSLELIMTDDSDQALRIAEELDLLNIQRKADQLKIFEAANILATQYEEDPVLVLAGRDWSHGVVGIVASKLVERWHKPVLVAQQMGEKTKGSARSVPGFNIVEALRSQSELFTKVGGHYFAAGYTLPSERIDELRRGLNEYAIKHPPDAFSDDIETEIELGELNLIEWELLRALELMEPFGAGNKRPLLRFEAMDVVEVRTMGRDRTHLRVVIKDQAGRRLSGVGFGMAPDYGSLPPGAQIDIVGYLVRNDYNGSSNIQLMVEKITNVNR